MSEWQPIETAPKDGTRVLMFERGIFIARWVENAQFGDGDESRPGWQIWSNEMDQFYSVSAENPTHWMPLPAPPTSPES